MSLPMRTPSLSFAMALAAAASAPAQLVGSYVVGPGGTYANVAAAIAALTTSGVAGPVDFLVTANDTGPWTIPAFPGQGAANPVTFLALTAPVTLSGSQPVLTLAGCASVAFSGFVGQFTTTGAAIVVAGATADCTFTNCTFLAPTTTSGNGAVFDFTGGSGCRIEDCTFGGSWQALASAAANSTTTVQRCRIVGGGFRIMTIGGSDFTLVNNVITGTSNYGINAGIPGATTSAANLKIWHNTVHIVHPGASNQYCSLRWYTSAPGTEVVDNVFVDDFTAATTSAFNMWCSLQLRPALMDNTCFWSNQPGYFPVFAGTVLTFSGWQALGFDANSIQADPQFVAPTATPPDLSLQPTSPCANAGTLLPAVLTDFALLPRTAPTSLGAFEQDGGTAASYAVFGLGCAGTSGVPGNGISALPRLGTSPMITFSGLPAPNIAVAVLGLSNTTHGAIPLPFDLGVIGAPGCPARVALDVTLGLAGAGGQATLVFPIPNNPLFVGLTFHTQAFVLDTPLNVLGMSTSDAATCVIGP